MAKKRRDDLALPLKAEIFELYGEKHKNTYNTLATREESNILMTVFGFFEIGRSKWVATLFLF